MLADAAFYFLCYFRVVEEELLHGIPSLANLAVAVGKPRSTLAQNGQLYAHVYDLADLGYAFAKYDVELYLAEWRCYLILYHLHARAVAGSGIAVLYLADAGEYRGVWMRRISMRYRR